ncbi:MAG: DUF6680 family protein [Bacteroidota bacterium]
MTPDTKDTFEVIYWIAYLFLVAITAYYVKTSPIKAVEAGRKLNDEQNRDTAMRNLFLTLYSYRGLPTHPHFVDGLNRIDILFHEHRTVITAWKNLHNSMSLPEGTTETLQNRETWKLLRATLLDEMGTVLGYKGLKQVDMLKYYFPQKHADYENFEYDRQEAEVNFHKTAVVLYNKFYTNIIEAEEAKQVEDNSQKHPE